MLAARDMMANFHFHDLEVLPESTLRAMGSGTDSSEAHAPALHSRAPGSVLVGSARPPPALLFYKLCGLHSAA